MAYSKKRTTAPKNIKQQERATQALNLRREGASYNEIGKAMGVSRERAFAIVKGELEKLAATVNEASEDVRRIELERLDAMQRKAFAKAVEGDTGAVDAVLRIMDRRAKLLGLNTPSEISMTHQPRTVIIKAPDSGYASSTDGQ
jgi:hypothetical protein